MTPIPYQAGILLDFIQSIEAPRGYDTIYANAKTPTPLTQMTLTSVLTYQTGWTKKNGSSAAGGLQIMRDTLKGLITEMNLAGATIFDREMQRQMGYRLLQRRGYSGFMLGKLSVAEFAKQLACEWASFPVLTATRGAHRQLKRGQSYYMGDKVNKALVAPARVEAVLNKMRGKGATASAVSSAVTAVAETSTTTKVVGAGAAITGAGTAVVAGTQDAQTTLDQIAPITNTISYIGTYGLYVAGAIVGVVVVAFALTALYKYAKS